MLAERHNTHGNFKDSSVFVQDLKNLMRLTPNWDLLEPHKKEALEMVVHKFGRLIYGNVDYEDHIDDAIGYLQRGFQHDLHTS